MQESISRTRIKICGITRTEDALLAAKLGADAIGLVFYPQSPRYVTGEKAVEIIHALPAFVTVVGLFVDATISEVKKILQTVPLNLLQLHGDESTELCDSYEKPYIKVIRMMPEINVTEKINNYPNAAAILLDTYHAQQKGGTGATFDWNLIPQDTQKPIILAGGLNSDNVEEAIHKVNPYAVDISSGVESSPGVKDSNKLISFIGKVQHVNCKK